MVFHRLVPDVKLILFNEQKRCSLDVECTFCNLFTVPDFIVSYAKKTSINEGSKNPPLIEVSH